MKNADMPAMPVVDEDGVLDCAKYEEFVANPSIATGLTKREMFAMHAMQGIVTKSDFCNNDNDIKVAAEWAVSCADALLAELERTK